MVKSRNAYNTYGWGRGTVIYGTEGSVHVNRNHYKVYDRFGKLIEDSGNKSNESGLALGGGGSATTRHASNLIASIRGKETLRAPISDASKSNHLALLANISYRCGKPLELDSSNGKAITPEAQQFWKRDYEQGWEIE